MSVSAVEQEMKELKENVVTKADAVKLIEEKLSAMGRNSTATMPCVLALGGLEQPSKSDAKSWVNAVLSDKGGPTPIDSYNKSRSDEPFKGLLFVKFGTTAQATAALEILREKCHGENRARQADNEMWCNYERPVEERAVRNILFGTKYLLSDKFKLPKSYVKVDEDACTLKAGGEPVMTVSINQDKVHIRWHKKEWEEWAELVQSPEFVEIVKAAERKISDSFAAKSKGDGKGHL